MPLPRCYNFAGFDLPTKFGWINDSPGMNVVAPVADGLKGFGGTILQAVQDSDTSMKNLGVTWAGPAATAAQQSLTRTADGASETERVTTNGADRLLDYGRSYEHMRNQIAFVDPARYSWVQRAGDNISEGWQSLWGNGQDHVSIGEKNQANDAAANRALQMHQVQTETADNRFTTAAAAPAPQPVNDASSPAGAAPGGPAQQTSPPPVSPAGGGDADGRSVAAPPPVSPATASPTTSPPGGGAAPTPIPPAGGGAGPGGPGGGGAGSGGGGAGGSAAPEGTGPGRNGGTPNRSVPDAPTATAQTPSTAPSTASQGGQNLGQQIPNAPSVGAGNVAGGGLTGGGSGGGLGNGAWGPGAPALNDPSARRAELGRNFGRDLTAGRLTAPGGGGYGGSSRPSTGWGGAPASGGAGSSRLGWGAESGAGRSTGGGWGGESGGRAAAGEQRGWARGGAAEGPGGRAAVAEPAAGGRSGTGSGYGPMMGGAGAGAGQNGQDHRNRYLIPTDEAFDVDLTCTPPVLGPLTDDERD